MRHNIIIIATLLLTACGTPQERCISQQTRELRNVLSLTAEVEGNLSRGYRWAERSVVRTRYTECEYTRRNANGEIEVLTRSCLRDVVEQQRYRDPIDPVTEARKLANLEKRADALRAQAERGVAACRVAYPEAEAPAVAAAQ